jgi:hypothetical protein
MAHPQASLSTAQFAWMTQAKLQELYEEKLNRDELAKDGLFVRRNLGVKEVEETADGVRVTLGIAQLLRATLHIT